jgi:hypothetical protein
LETPCCPGGYFLLSKDLSYPKIASPNVLAFFEVGPVYLAIIYYINDDFN